MPKWLAIILWLTVPSLCFGQDAVYFENEEDSLRFGNESVELIIDAHNGYFREIINKKTGIHHKKADYGVWPFGLTVGTREKPEQMRAEIRANSIQQMRYEVGNTTEGGKRLSLIYPMLVDNATSKPTGVGLGVNILLAPEHDYFIIRTEIANGGPLWLTDFYAGHGEVITGDDARTSETVWVPARGGASHKSFSYTKMGLPTYAWGWSDYSGTRGGLGMAYINQQGIQYMMDWKKTKDGLLQGWHLFDTNGYWHFESRMNDYQKSLLIQPLEPANNFTTDEWLIIPHEGDWHRTADVYRERYQEVFKSDYLDWEHLPENVKNMYVRFGLFISENSIGNSYPRQVYNSLDSIVPQVETAMEGIGADSKRLAVSLIFFHPHVGRYPEFFPIDPAAGGEKGWEEMMRDLHKWNWAYVTGYAHLSYNHRAAKNYVPEADPLDTIPPINPTAGHRACVDNDAWAKLWRDELIPAYKAHGFNAVFADEGHFPWGTCAATGPAHLHGPTGVGILTGNTRGIIRLHELLHEGLGQNSVIEVEGAGDVSGRWADVSQAYPDPSVAYTLPFKRYAWFIDKDDPEPKLMENINTTLAHGYAIMVNLSHEKPIKNFVPLRHYVETRRKLEEARAPGYPQGFRDTVGLKVSNSSLVAKAFTDAQGMTVTCFAKTAVETEISVDGAALGHASAGIQRHPVKLNPDDFLFLVISPAGSVKEFKTNPSDWR